MVLAISREFGKSVVPGAEKVFEPGILQGGSRDHGVAVLSWGALQRLSRLKDSVVTYLDPAERGCLRLFYRGWHPTRLGKLVSKGLAWMSGVHLTPPILLTLQVPGRRSGRLLNTILVVTHHKGQRYLVSMLGDGSDWVRNVRAANGKAFVKRGPSRPVQLTEVPISERAPILKAYCQVATSGREHFPVPHDAPVAEFDSVAERYPVFRIDPA